MVGFAGDMTRKMRRGDESSWRAGYEVYQVAEKELGVEKTPNCRLVDRGWATRHGGEWLKPFLIASQDQDDQI